MLNWVPARLKRLILATLLGGTCSILVADKVSLALDDPPPELSVAAKSKLNSELRSAAAKTRLKAIGTLSELPNREALRLIIQQGLRDRSDEVVKASLDAIDRIGGAINADDQSWFVSELIEPIKTEFGGHKRRSVDFSIRVIRAAARMPTVPMYEKLLAVGVGIADEPKAAWMSGLLYGIDDLGERHEVRLLEVVGMLEQHSDFGLHYGMRRALYDAVGKIPRPESVTFLIKQLKNAAGESRGVIATNLQRLTQFEGGIEYSTWHDWWAKNSVAFNFPAQAEYPLLRAENSTPTYYGLPVYAERLVFILDTSKSMAVGGREPRIEVAKRELIRAIQNLPETTLFNIVVFNSTVVPWHPSLAPASQEWKLQASAFVANQRPQGRTMTYEAVVQSMNIHRDLEAVYLLSDGAPSLGAVVNPERIVDAIATQNHLRRLTIHTIGLFGGGADDVRGLEGFMRSLAARNFGQFRRVD